MKSTQFEDMRVIRFCNALNITKGHLEHAYSKERAQGKMEYIQKGFTICQVNKHTRKMRTNGAFFDVLLCITQLSVVMMTFFMAWNTVNNLSEERVHRGNLQKTHLMQLREIRAKLTKVVGAQEERQRMNKQKPPTNMKLHHNLKFFLK